MATRAGFGITDRPDLRRFCLRRSFLVHAATSFLLVALPPARAEVVDDLAPAKPACPANLTASPRPVVHRLTVPYYDREHGLIPLASVITDFVPTRDVVVGIRDKKHTYLVNARIGRRDPGLFGARGKFHPNSRNRRLMVSPGLILRLRLPALAVDRMAAEIQRTSRSRNLTCTNRVARILAHAGVPRMHAFVFSPLQMMRAFGDFEGLDARIYLVNSEAEGLEEFEDGIKVVGAKKPPSPAESEPARRDGSASCDGEDVSDGCMVACLDLDWCTASCGPGGGGGGSCGIRRFGMRGLRVRMRRLRRFGLRRIGVRALTIAALFGPGRPAKRGR